MRIRSRHKTLLLAAALALVPAVLPATASADHRQQPVRVVATISACAGEGLTIAAEVEPRPGAERGATRRTLRALRRATLRMRFEAAPLYGRSRTRREIDFGRTTSARRFERFEELPAQTYSGAVRYRWVRGKRTVLSGIARTRATRAAGRRGRAFCALRVGKRPVDTRAPLIFPLPGDSGWKRGPLNVYLWTLDDLSGVALVVSQLDGGSFRRGHNVQITTEGTHQLAYIARDAAGNQSTPATVTLRVDTNPPTAPAITAPSGSTADSTPDIRWDASTDTASGVLRYFPLVRNSSGAIVWSQEVAAGSPRAVTVGQTLAPGQYTAEVVAQDMVGFTSKSSSAFTVTGSGPATAGDADGDTVADASDNCPSAANTDQANTDGAADGGDACDANDDNDAVADATDNCPLAVNDAQTNTDGAADGGDACDPDDDNDGDLDGADNCPLASNSAQTNTDGANDGGDACDSDDDNDGVDDGQDACPTQGPSFLGLKPDGCPV